MNITASTKRAIRLGIASLQQTEEAKNQAEIWGMKSTLRYCGVTEDEIKVLEAKHGKWNRLKWNYLYNHYMANGDFYKKHNYNADTATLLEAFNCVKLERSKRDRE